MNFNSEIGFSCKNCSTI